MTERTASNPLAVRLTLSKSITRQVQGKGDDTDWEKIIATIEADKPEGVDALEGLRQLDVVLTAYLATVTGSAPTAQQPQEKTVEKPPEPPKTKLDLTAFNDAKVNSKGGRWLFADKIPELANKVQQAGNTLDVEGGRLTLSKDGKFLTLWGAKK